MPGLLTPPPPPRGLELPSGPGFAALPLAQDSAGGQAVAVVSQISDISFLLLSG